MSEVPLYCVGCFIKIGRLRLMSRAGRGDRRTEGENLAKEGESERERERTSEDEDVPVLRDADTLQGYLTHKKTHPPRTLP